MLNNAKPYLFLNELNKKDLPAMYSTAFWCLFVVLLFFLAVLRNHKQGGNDTSTSLLHCEKASACTRRVSANCHNAN